MPNPEIHPQKRPRLVSRGALWRDVSEIILLIASIYTLVNVATARAVVEGASMKPNFETGQLIIVNRFAYFFDAPQRGDVIVLHNPNNPQEDFIKRVIGLPGETVQILDGRVYINGSMLEEPYIAKFCDAICDGLWYVGPDEYFVLGDNRGSSHDSHSFGAIPRRLIVGQAWIRYFPLNQFSIIHHPDYGRVNPTYIPLLPTPTRMPLPILSPTPESDMFGG